MFDDRMDEESGYVRQKMGGSVAVVNGKIYAIGGAEMQKEQPVIIHPPEVYDPMTNTWTKLMDMQIPRLMLSSSVVNAKIYAIGGANKHKAVLSTVEEYTPEGWRAISPRGKLPTKWGEIK